MGGFRPTAGRRSGRSGVSPGGSDGPTPGSVAAEAPEADPEAVARSICLRQLTLGPRSRGQLAEVLMRRDVPEDVAERVLDRLAEVGLIDDAAFAAAWVRTRVAGKGLARRAIAGELRARGVDEDVAADALEVLDGDEERATARALVDRRLPATRGLAPEVRMRRLGGMLARKGYGHGLALQVVRDALADEGADTVAREAP
jgi:regulatory protein